MSTGVIEVIEHHEDLREATSILLRTCGWTVGSSESPEAFLDKMQTQQTDCLVLALKFPGLSGADLLEQLAGRNIRILAVVVTAWPDSDLAARAKAAGASAILEKPYDIDRLAEAITSALSSPRFHRHRAYTP